MEANPELKSCFAALPAECFQEIARLLPTGEQEMLDVDQVGYLAFSFSINIPSA